MVRITVTHDIELDLDTAAEWFSGISDDEMCKFFVKVAEHAKVWPGTADTMWYEVGKHLATCECSTEEARNRRFENWRKVTKKMMLDFYDNAVATSQSKMA